MIKLLKISANKSTVAALAFAIGAGLSTVPAVASHHFESKLAQEHPQFDLTDMFVFDSERRGYTAFMMDVNPSTKDRAAFGEKGVYSFHIANDKSFGSGGVTITAHLEGEQLVFGLVDGANQAVGTKGKAFGKAKVGKTVKFNNGVKVWSGAARDPFVGNSEGIVGFLTALIGKGKLELSQFNSGVDLFKDFNSSIILVELPNSMLAKNIHVYASSAMYNVDQWVQVNRVANPLVTHMFLANNKMEVSEHIQHRPDSDMSRRYAISGMVLRAVALDRKLSNPVEYADSVAAQLLPDMISYKVGSSAEYGYPKVNGRKPSDDGMDAVLSLLVGRNVTDHANTFNRHPVKFPYVVPVR
ncbi:DUF4331 family protein [Pseudoalteromonas luteoviolacea]|uniref:DUF4331 domain-containing protein n=1 Tax=Pseudoalteromonas luteoviolacea H33 TaxID=1365251 RepID=A0A167GTH6_9GAMM|nr:DUF4331 family protein [Pseudoalteromonas luteoviolacea]KZN56534.1 hypothetical protein N476_00225 [Pseudoalteromonas luteoviolacea H33]KZN75637.1 hypothetical protein N477_18280 [Pseudoalteromonas luteoviolacea H33-S]MBQ4876411.1 DUF4331 family protein [Pseudoalteromonas luteoviolacea]MBQ4905042.1 DUF4331 family protein [Pseudoalteromonas luteoviolacea]